MTARRPLRAAIRYVTVPVISGLATYLLLELVVFPLMLPHLPLAFASHLPAGTRALGQSSKAAAVPRHYLAIVGDSYAAGAGDWLRSTSPRRSEPYHSAHLIHDALGVDVVSFGANGAGSLAGIVSAPIAELSYLSALQSVAPPDGFLVYFYAGNDLNDNLRELREHYPVKFPAESLRDPRVFDRFLDRLVQENPIYQRARAGLPWTDRLLIGRTAVDVIRSRGGSPFETPPINGTGLNRANVGGHDVSLPDALQSPGLELTEDEVSLAIYVFERSVAYLMKTYPTAQVRVVYLPSPVECYRIVSPTVDIQTYEERARTFDTAALETRARLVSSSVRAAAERLGVRFVDVTTGLRRVSENALVHGPLDWKHYNRAGYQAVADAVVSAIR